MKHDITVDNKTYKRCWIDEIQDRAYDSIKEENKIPLVIVSYNRPDMKIKKLIYEGKDWENKHWPIYVLVRDTQRASYEEAVGERIKVISAQDDLINSCDKAKNYVLHHFDRAFIFDDDIEHLDRSYHQIVTGEDGKITEYARSLTLNKLRELDIGYNICDALALWQISFDYAERLNDRVVASSVGVDGMTFTPNYIDAKNSLTWFGKSVWTCWLVDCKKAVSIGMSIRDNKVTGHEDFDFYCQAVDRCYFVVGFNWMTCKNDLKPNPDFLLNGVSNNMIRYSTQQKLSYGTWSAYLDKYTETKSKLPNVKVNRKRVKDHYTKNGYMPVNEKVNLFNEDLFNDKKLEPIEFKHEELNLFDMMK